MLRLDGVAITEGHRPFNGTGQLPDISRERIVPEHPQSDIAELDEPPVMPPAGFFQEVHRSEEHTSELQSRPHLVCRLLLEKKKRLRRSCGRGTKEDRVRSGGVSWRKVERPAGTSCKGLRTQRV